MGKGFYLCSEQMRRAALADGFVFTLHSPGSPKVISFLSPNFAICQISTLPPQKHPSRRSPAVSEQELPVWFLCFSYGCDVPDRQVSSPAS